MVNAGLYITYVLIAIAALAVILFGIKQILGDPKKLKQFLMSIGGIVVVLLISYLLSSGELTERMAKMGYTSGTAKWVGVGLNMFYLLAAGAIGATIYSSVSRFTK